MNLFISLLNKAKQAFRRLLCAQPNTGDAGVSPAVACPSAQSNSPASPERRGEAMSSGHRGKGAGWYTRLQAALANTPAIKLAKYLIPAAVFILLLIYLSSCKSPATLTSDTQHHTRDSTRHTTVHRIETHDTIVIGPSKSPLKGDFGFSPLRGS